jgi:hypothetical protein
MNVSQVVDIAAKTVAVVPAVEVNAFSIVLSLLGAVAGAAVSLVVSNWLFGRDIATLKTQIGFLVDALEPIRGIESRISRLEGRTRL